MTNLEFFNTRARFARKNIPYLRKSRGMTQQALAEALDVGRSTIGAIEEGRQSPTLSVLHKISVMFEISLEDVLFRDLAKEMPELLTAEKVRPSLDKKIIEHKEKMEEYDRLFATLQQYKAWFESLPYPPQISGLYEEV